MPKLKRSETERQNLALVAKVHYKMELYGYHPRDIAPILGISRATWYVRIKNPGKFTLAELRSISKVLKIPFTELFTVEQ